MHRGWIFLAALAVLTLTSGAQAQTLEAVRARGMLNCGVSTGIAGFSQPDTQGTWRGLDVDICRAVAAAVLGDASKVKYVPLTTQARFTAIQSGEVDVLSRTATWTMGRDTSLGLDFIGVVFFDGQGFMVPRRLNVKSAKELNGATVCVQPGTITEVNLADYFRTNNMRFTPVVIERVEEVLAAYFSGRCDVYTSDVSQITAQRASQAPNPADHVILPEVISKEPLSPAVRQGDSRWSDIVRWSLFALLEAEELGLTSQNIDQHLNSQIPAIQRFVGATGNLGEPLALDARWAYAIVKQVGNYAESFERNMAPLGIQRGINRLWRDGGILFAPPMR
jgi:general L-amino acid transport system substrate-binding protein